MSVLTKSRTVPSPFSGQRTPYATSNRPFGESITGEVTRRKPQGQNECTHERVVCLVSSGACYEKYKTNPMRPFAPTIDPKGAGYKLLVDAYGATGSIPSFPSNSALAKSYADYCSALASAGRSDLQVISFAREMSKTIGMLKNPFSLVTGISKLLGPKGSKRCRNVPFGDLVKAGPGTVRLVAKKKIHPNSNRFRDAVSAGSGAWLEGTYGWQPFLNDVIGALPGVTAANEARRQMKTMGDVPFSFPVTMSSEASFSASPYSGTPFYVKEGHCLTKTRARLYGTWSVNPSVAAEGACSSLARALNIDRLGYAVWDAVPYSFVADWFLPLGEKVDNALSGPTFYINASSPWLSQRVENTYVMAFAASPADFGGIKYSGAATYAELVSVFRRGPCDMGQLSLKAKGMHGTRIASGFALAWGAITRRLR